MLIDHTNGRVLDVLENRDKASVVRWLTDAKQSGLLASLAEVTCDMWDAYVEAAREVFGPSVRIVIDRFHVMKNFQDRLTDARRQLQKGLGKKQAGLLKGSRWLWVSNPENLTPEERKRLEQLKHRFPQLGRLAEHREALRQIFEDRRLATPADAMAQLWSWWQQGEDLGLAALKRFNKTLVHWMQTIANYFVSRSTNARTEGLNRGLRTILWRACGMQNFDHFRLRVLHVFG